MRYALESCARRSWRQGCLKRLRRRSLLRTFDWGGMTHAESQTCLLDLAYGELDARAPPRWQPCRGMRQCRKEKAASEETRRMAAPCGIWRSRRRVRRQDPGCRAAQAQLEHDGNVGQVIEVDWQRAPLGLEAARIDAHGPSRRAQPAAIVPAGSCAPPSADPLRRLRRWPWW